MPSICGRVGRILHRTDDFYIFSLEAEGARYSKQVTCKGHVFGILQLVVGTPIQLIGEWVIHPKFGSQFAFYGWKPWASTKDGVGTFLRYSIGVLSEIYLEAIVKAFGVDAFTVLTKEPDRVRSLPEFVVDTNACEGLLKNWSYALTSAELSSFFSDQGVTSEQMQSVFRAFGAESRKVVEENPYRLLEVNGFTFAKVDEVAFRVGVERSDPRRYEGGVLWVLREAAKSGHLCVRRIDIASELVDLIKNNEVSSFQGDIHANITQAVDRLEKRGGVKVDPSVGVYLPDYFKYERESASILSKFLTPVKLEVDLEEFVSSYETVNQIKLSEAQWAAVAKLVNSKVLVLTGLPGTGKTTVIRTFVRLFEQAGVSFVLMAPTGIAAKRLASVTGHPAATIHRTFRYDGEKWGFNGYNKYGVGAVIVDEMSMVDQELFFRILDAIQEDTILVLVGDDAQLPSVGPGNVLRELIRCSSIPTVRLTQIFRQAEASDIVLNSHRVNRGEEVVIRGKDSDFQFVKISNEAKIADLIVQMAVKLKSRDANFQVLSPKYEGEVGVTNLNNKLREALNPPSIDKSEYEAGLAFPNFRVREGDRLMVIQNDYKLNIYNGDMAKLISVTYGHLVIKVHGAGENGLDMLVEIPVKEAPIKLRLAYAITVHKAQGSEFDTVVLPIVRGQGRMLQRNLFYTAITRAKQKVWLLGESEAVKRAIDNDKVVQRGTGFEKAIVAAVAEGATIQ